jgi:hypothetical protein
VKEEELPNYPVVVIHLIDPPYSGRAACCGLRWKRNIYEQKGQVLWLCTGCLNAIRRKGDGK